MEYHLSYLVLDVFFIVVSICTGFVLTKLSFWIIGYVVFIDDWKELKYKMMGIYSIIIYVLLLGVLMAFGNSFFYFSYFPNSF